MLNFGVHHRIYPGIYNLKGFLEEPTTNMNQTIHWLTEIKTSADKKNSAMESICWKSLKPMVFLKKCSEISEHKSSWG